MTPELERAAHLRIRADRATNATQRILTYKMTAKDILDAPPDVRERMVEMADACEAFVRAWQRRDG